MVILRGWVFLMSEVPLYGPDRACPLHPSFSKAKKPSGAVWRARAKRPCKKALLEA